MRRFATIALSLSLVLGLTATNRTFAQDPEKKDASTPEVKKDDAPKEDVKKDDAPKEEVKKDDAPKEEVKKPDAPKEEVKKPDAPKDEAKDVKKDDTSTAAELPPIPPEVEAKLEAARHAVAEAIVAAQDAGLVQTTIEPPPILDILVTGRATDEKSIKDRTGVSLEVFGAWFTKYNKPIDGITAMKDVRIIEPSKGLQAFFDQRAAILNKHIKAVRDAQGGDKPKDEAAKKDEVKPTEEPAKKDEAKKDETKKDEAKPAEEPAKKDETKKDEAK